MMNSKTQLFSTCNAKGRWRRCARLLSKFGRVAAAVIVAAVFAVVWPRLGWPRLRGAIKTWVRYLFMGGTTASPSVYSARMDACAKCPLFYSPLRSCSSPISKESPQLGCWCNVEAAAAIESKTCWLDDELEGYENGWKAVKKRLADNRQLCK